MTDAPRGCNVQYTLQYGEQECKLNIKAFSFLYSQLKSSLLLEQDMLLVQKH